MTNPPPIPPTPDEAILIRRTGERRALFLELLNDTLEVWERDCEAPHLDAWMRTRGWMFAADEIEPLVVQLLPEALAFWPEHASAEALRGALTTPSTLGE